MALDGLVICCSGALSVPRKQLQSKIRSYGGGIADSVTRACTHLITTDRENDYPSTKVYDARDAGIPILSESFLDACIAAGDWRKVDEKAHGFSSPKDARKKARHDAPPTPARHAVSSAGAAASAAGGTDGGGKKAPLEGCVFHFVGQRFEDSAASGVGGTVKTRGDVTKLIELKGGSCSRTFGRHITHVLLGEDAADDVKKGIDKLPADADTSDTATLVSDAALKELSDGERKLLQAASKSGRCAAVRVSFVHAAIKEGDWASVVNPRHFLFGAPPPPKKSGGEGTDKTTAVPPTDVTRMFSGLRFVFLSKRGYSLPVSEWATVVKVGGGAVLERADAKSLGRVTHFVLPVDGTARATAETQAAVTEADGEIARALGGMTDGEEEDSAPVFVTEGFLDECVLTGDWHTVCAEDFAPA